MHEQFAGLCEFPSAAFQLHGVFLDLHRLLQDLTCWPMYGDVLAPAPFYANPGPSAAAAQPPHIFLGLNMLMQDLPCCIRFLDVLAPVPFYTDPILSTAAVEPSHMFPCLNVETGFGCYGTGLQFSFFHHFKQVM